MTGITARNNRKQSLKLSETKLRGMSAAITGHMVVKNEDAWVWFAIQSTLPFVDKLLITDTGSTDKTIKIINSIKSNKIAFTSQNAASPSEMTKIRQHQLERTKTDWFWLIDGDEIYPTRTAEEILWAIDKGKAKEGIVVRRHDLLGDVYHRQKETVGTYNLYGKSGHLVTRLFNKSAIPGLHVSGLYPDEGYFDKDKTSTRHRNPKNYYITENRLWHTMYLKRSSLGSNLASVINRSKYKIEKGLPIKEDLPEVFYKDRPPFVPDPLQKRSLLYELAASLMTPAKDLKRKYL